MDAKTIRVAQSFYDRPNEGNQKYAINGCLPSYVQVFQHNIWQEFYPWELAVGIRNPRTDIYSSEYGMSELEDLVQTITAMLNLDAYNANFFTQGTTPKGMMLVNGYVPNQDAMTEFEEKYKAKATGVENAHKILALDAEKYNWIDLHKNNRDMEFSAYQEYLIRTICAHFKISPDEIGFKERSGGLGNYRSKAANREELDYSKEKGLVPLLRSFQRSLNKYLIGPMSKEKLELVFVGTDVETEQQEDERLIKLAEADIIEINEARGIKGLPTDKKEYNTMKSMLNADSEPYGQGGEDGGEDGGGGKGDPQKIKKTARGNPISKGLDEWWEEHLGQQNG